MNMEDSFLFSLGFPVLSGELCTLRLTNDDDEMSNDEEHIEGWDFWAFAKRQGRGFDDEMTACELNDLCLSAWKTSVTAAAAPLVLSRGSLLLVEQYQPGLVVIVRHEDSMGIHKMFYLAV
jgi:hypothetical protein